MPGVRPEEHRFARPDADHLARLRIRDDQVPVDRVKHLVGPEHGPEAGRMSELAAGGDLEQQLVDPVVGDVYPVEDLS